MKKIEAPTLQEAYTQASVQLGCSITELKFEIIQNPSKGFLGFFKKSAIIVAHCTKEATPVEQEQKEEVQNTPIENVVEVQNEVVEKVEVEEEHDPVLADIKAVLEQSDEQHDRVKRQPKRERSFDRHPPVDTEKVVAEIKLDLESIFAFSCFDIEIVDVSMYDEKTVKVKFDGADAALLIGKEGYRYKALSYMLFNWINPKYHLLLRLEVAEFLQNQEEQVHKYLESVIEQVRENGKAQTKILDGVLVQIALKELRATFPEKYVAIRTNSTGEKYIIVNEFISKQ